MSPPRRPALVRVAGRSVTEASGWNISRPIPLTSRGRRITFRGRRGRSRVAGGRIVVAGLGADRRELFFCVLDLAHEPLDLGVGAAVAGPGLLRVDHAAELFLEIADLLPGLLLVELVLACLDTALGHLGALGRRLLDLVHEARRRGPPARYRSVARRAA